MSERTIVERLRDLEFEGRWAPSVIEEAAEEIERLEALVRELRERAGECP